MVFSNRAFLVPQGLELEHPEAFQVVGDGCGAVRCGALAAAASSGGYSYPNGGGGGGSHGVVGGGGGGVGGGDGGDGGGGCGGVCWCWRCDGGDDGSGVGVGVGGGGDGLGGGIWRAKSTFAALLGLVVASASWRARVDFRSADALCEYNTPRKPRCFSL